MTEPAAFQATVHGFRTVPTRKVVQITIEAPIEQHSLIAAIAEHGAWVGVARIQKPPEEAEKPNGKREYSLPQRVAMVCNEQGFRRFLQEQNGWRSSPGFDLVDEQKAAELVREYCGVDSRSKILPGTEAARKWDSLHAQYLMWQRT